MRARAVASDKPCSRSIPNRRRNLASSWSERLSVSWDVPLVECCTTVLFVDVARGAGGAEPVRPCWQAPSWGAYPWTFSTNTLVSVSRSFFASGPAARRKVAEFGQEKGPSRFFRRGLKLPSEWRPQRPFSLPLPLGPAPPTAQAGSRPVGAKPHNVGQDRHETRSVCRRERSAGLIVLKVRASDPSTRRSPSDPSTRRSPSDRATTGSFP